MECQSAAFMFEIMDISPGRAIQKWAKVLYVPIEAGQSSRVLVTLEGEVIGDYRHPEPLITSSVSAPYYLNKALMERSPEIAPNGLAG